jgi:hypothetical protein
MTKETPMSRPSDHSPISQSTTIVLVDPTSPDGHSSLDALTDDDTDLLVVVLLSGRASNALRDFAHHENVSVSEAGWIYLDQVAVRLEQPGRTVGTILATGPDTAQSLADIAIQHDADRVVLPTSILRLDRTVVRRLAQLAPVMISVPDFRALVTVG